MRHTQDMPLFTLERPGDFVGGEFEVPSAPDGELIIANPGDLDDITAVHPYSVAQVDRAVQAARDAALAWRRTPEHERAEILTRYRDRLKAHREEIALCIAREVGKPLWEARGEADAMATKVDVMLGEGAAYTATQRVEGVGEIRYRPLGVVAVIGPFNFPGHLPNGQIVPALALGNSVVHKPSDKTPSTATWIARCLSEAGLPHGVFNLVQGPAESGRALTAHEGVDGVLFTGSAEVGRRIVADNATRLDRLVALELGGKNAAIALDDCELEATARAVTFAAFATAGQRCTSTSRLLVTPRIAAPLIERVCALTRSLHVGYPLDEDVFMGPMISDAARRRLWTAQRRADDAGFSALLAGGEAEIRGRRGHYALPALRRAPKARCAVRGYTDSELFGPDLAVFEVADLDEAVAVANATPFGLAAAVFTRSQAAFEEAAQELRVGVVHHNKSSAGASGRLPFGGVKSSGNHRPAGILAGTTCVYPQAVLTSAAIGSQPPAWPGLPGKDVQKRQ